MVGDISRAEVGRSIGEHFKRWGSAPSIVPPLPVTYAHSRKKKVHSHVPSKENVDVFLGVAANVRVTDDEYVPLSVAAELLGSSGFTGHLMKTVRDRDGLTYGIYARLRDVSSNYPLLFMISATFGNALVSKGVKRTLKEIRSWLKSHITERALAEKKREIAGSSIVSLQDPEELAWKLMSTICAGNKPAYLHEYIQKVNALKADDVRRVARRYLPLHAIAQSSAGSLAPK